MNDTESDLCYQADFEWAQAGQKTRTVLLRFLGGTLPAVPLTSSLTV